MYGQNWVEQMREARRVIHFVPIYNSGCCSPYAMVDSMINDPFYALPHLHSWERRKQKFMTHESERIYYALID